MKETKMNYVEEVLSLPWFLEDDDVLYPVATLITVPIEFDYWPGSVSIDLLDRCFKHLKELLDSILRSSSLLFVSK